MLKKRWREYFGFFTPPQKNKPNLWVHTVSVGETITAAPLVKAIQKTYPHYNLIVTTTTPTGSERAAAIYGDTIFHVFAPYDLPGAVNRFLDKIQPKLAIFMETELWPNILASCQQRHIKTCLTNARLSEKSANGYRRFSFLTRPMLQQLTGVAAQYPDDGDRLIKLGLSPQKLHITGTLKYDMQLDPSLKEKGAQLRQKWLKNKPAHTLIFIAASTHEGEESIIIDSFKTIQKQCPDLLLLLVPRHPERFEHVAQLIKQSQLTLSRRSLDEEVTEDCQCILGDTMGEMMLLYSACHIALVGGSFIENGGHNYLEPAVVGLPVLSGPSTFNFQDVTCKLESANAMKILPNQIALSHALIELYHSEVLRKSMGKAGLKLIADNKGALEKQLKLVQMLLQ